MDNENKQDAAEPSPASAGSAALQQCVLGIISLHRLIFSGQGDSDKADAVRDSVQVHFSTLTSDEAAVAQTLSAELYRPQLTNDERDAIKRLGPSSDPLARFTVTLTPEERKVFRGLLERLG